MQKFKYCWHYILNCTNISSIKIFHNCLSFRFNLFIQHNFIQSYHLAIYMQQASGKLYSHPTLFKNTYGWHIVIQMLYIIYSNICLIVIVFVITIGFNRLHPQDFYHNLKSFTLFLDSFPIECNFEENWCSFDKKPPQLENQQWKRNRALGDTIGRPIFDHTHGSMLH